MSSNVWHVEKFSKLQNIWDGTIEFILEKRNTNVLCAQGHLHRQVLELDTSKLILQKKRSNVCYVQRNSEILIPSKFIHDFTLENYCNARPVGKHTIVLYSCDVTSELTLKKSRTNVHIVKRPLQKPTTRKNTKGRTQERSLTNAHFVEENSLMMPRKVYTKKYTRERNLTCVQFVAKHLFHHQLCPNMQRPTLGSGLTNVRFATTRMLKSTLYKNTKDQATLERNPTNAHFVTKHLQPFNLGSDTISDFMQQKKIKKTICNLHCVFRFITNYMT